MMASEPQPQTPQEYLEELLGGELPAEGLLFPTDPVSRTRTLIPTNPETVRTWLLRAIEIQAIEGAMPYSETGPDQSSQAALRFAQAYLLLDPSVDEAGVPVVHKAAAQAMGEMAKQEHQSELPQQGPGNFKAPPRVPQNAGERKVAQKNEGKTRVLKAARGQRPRPQPRVGS